MAKFNEKYNVEVFTVAEWAELDGYTEEEAMEVYRSEEGVPAVEIYANIDSAICGVKYADGRFGIFGAGMDTDNVTEEEMYAAIEAGF